VFGVLAAWYGNVKESGTLKCVPQSTAQHWYHQCQCTHAHCISNSVEMSLQLTVLWTENQLLLQECSFSESQKVLSLVCCNIVGKTGYCHWLFDLLLYLGKTKISKQMYNRWRYVITASRQTNSVWMTVNRMLLLMNFAELQVSKIIRLILVLVVTSDQTMKI